MAGAGSAFFSAANQKALESSFNEFIKRPENQRAVEDIQKQELQQALTAKDRARLLEFQDKLRGASLEVQQNLEPFLHHKVLRRVLQTLCNDPQQGLEVWATNPRVLQMLHHTASLLRDGLMTEQELQQILIGHLKTPTAEGAAEFRQHAQARITLGADMLVSALNEHLEERRQGNSEYKAGRLDKAREHYERALSIVELVQGGNAADQAEVQRNRMAVLMNLAAVDVALQRYGAVVARCTAVLEDDPGHYAAHLRRAKAQAERRAFEEAEVDIRAAERLQPECSGEAQQLRARMRALRLADQQTDRKFCSKLFS